MSKTFTITHKVDCALRLLDTTSGRPLAGRSVRLCRGEEVLNPLQKPGGYWIFMGLGQQNFTLAIHAQGYEPLQLPLCFAPDGAPLVLDAHLLPTPAGAAPDTVYTLTGEEASLQAVDAVPAGDNVCLVREFDKRRALLRVFNPHQLELDKVFYAIVDPDNGCYEVLEIKQRVSHEEYQVEPRPQKEIAAHFALSRRVLGSVQPNGAFLLRLRRSAGARWFVRYQTKGGERFETVDLNTLAPDYGGFP